MWGSVVVAISALLTVLAAHYWTLWVLAGIAPTSDAGNHLRALTLLLLLTSAHLSHVVGYAFLLGVLIDLEGWGGFSNADAGPVDLLYYSATAYTTLGFSDVVPRGGIRLVAVFEGLTGFMALTWSATFVYSSFRTTWRH